MSGACQFPTPTSPKTRWPQGKSLRPTTRRGCAPKTCSLPFFSQDLTRPCPVRNSVSNGTCSLLPFALHSRQRQPNAESRIGPASHTVHTPDQTQGGSLCASGNSVAVRATPPSGAIAAPSSDSGRRPRSISPDGEQPLKGGDPRLGRLIPCCLVDGMWNPALIRLGSLRVNYGEGQEFSDRCAGLAGRRQDCAYGSPSLTAELQPS